VLLLSHPSCVSGTAQWASATVWGLPRYNKENTRAVLPNLLTYTCNCSKHSWPCRPLYLPHSLSSFAVTWLRILFTCFLIYMQNNINESPIVMWYFLNTIVLKTKKITDAIQENCIQCKQPLTNHRTFTHHRLSKSVTLLYSSNKQLVQCDTQLAQLKMNLSKKYHWVSWDKGRLPCSLVHSQYCSPKTIDLNSFQSFFFWWYIRCKNLVVCYIWGHAEK
jgi:hypothetical protein